jgi:hypothetical protein
MTDTPAAIATLRAEFGKNAVLPRKQIAAAEKFIDQLNASMAQGVKPSPEALEAGHQLLRRIENQTQVFMFNAAIFEGLQDTAPDEMNRNLKVIGDRIDQAEQTSSRLRETLKSFA